jgi:NADH-quinone oxidoreductase subunit E
MEKDMIKSVITMHHHEKQAIQTILLDLQEKGIPLDKEALQVVANEIEIPLSRLFGIVTFYDAFRSEKPHHQSVCICNGLACHLRGSEKLYSQIEHLLNNVSKNLQNGQSCTIEEVSCLGCCAVGPNMMVYNEVYANPTIETIEQALNNGQKGEKA